MNDNEWYLAVVSNKQVGGGLKNWPRLISSTYSFVQMQFRAALFWLMNATNPRQNTSCRKCSHFLFH